MQKKIFIWFLGFLSVICLPSTRVTAQTKPPVIELSFKQSSYTLGRYLFFLEDKNGELSFDDVLKSAEKFKKSDKNNLNFGFSNATYWLKFRVKRIDSIQYSWLLNQEYPLIDHVELHYKNAAGNWQSKLNGDQLPIYAKSPQSRTIVFPLYGLTTNKTYTYYLKIKSSGTIQLPLSLQKSDYYHQKQVQTEMFYGIFTGILLLIIITNIFLGITFRKRVYFFYVLYIIGCLLLYTSLSGHTYQYLWGNFPRFNNPMIIISMGMLITGLAYFVQDFIKITQPFIKVILKGFSMVGILLLLMAFTVPYNKIVGVATITTGITILVTFVISIYAFVKKETSAKYFMLAFTIYALGAVVLTLKALGIFPISFFATYAAEIANVIEIILISFALSDRYKCEQLQYQEAKEQAQKETLQAQKKALQVQKDANENLEDKVRERTSELEVKNQKLVDISEELKGNVETLSATQELVKYNANLVLQKNRRIQGSIKSALGIQRAILPNKEERTRLLGEHYIIYRPKDVVSGDFYWMRKVNNKLVVAAVDCTGHGVPGAFMSLIGYNALEKIISGNKNTDPASALNELNGEIRKLFAKQKHFTNSGMDIVLITLESMPEGKTRLVFAGAKSCLYYIMPPHSTLNRIKGDNLFIGDLNKEERLFTNEEIILEKGSLIYTGSDGLRDQNDVNRKRLGMLRLETVLQENATLSMKEQKRALEETLDQHQRDTTQRDDILWMGIKL